MNLFVSIFGIFTSFILFYYMKDLNKSNKFLAAFFFITNFNILFTYVLLFSKSQFWEAVFFVHFLPITYFLSPVLFFYIKFSYKEYKFKWFDYLHFLPFLIVVILVLPYTFLPFKEKYLVAHEVLALATIYDPKVDVYNIGLLFYFKSIYKFAYTIFTLFYFRKLSNDFDLEWEKEGTGKKSFRNWIYCLITFQLFIAIISLGSINTIPGLNLFGINNYIFYNKEGLFRFTGFAIFAQNFVLFLFPKILFGNKNNFERTFDSTYANQLKTTLTKKQNNIRVDQQIDRYLEDYLPQMIYLEEGFNLAKLSFDLNISERVLSNYFNVYRVSSFSAWKNKLRIEQAVKMMGEANLKHYTIEGIGVTVGFQSRTNFIEVFKENVGITPSEYLKKIQKI